MSTIEEAIKLQKLANKKASEEFNESIPSDEIEEIETVEKSENIKSDKNFICLDTGKLQQKNFLALNNLGKENNSNKEQAILHEEFRHIKRKLLSNAYGAISTTLHNPNLIMITSAQANEGKTFISINLALSIAVEQDKTVLLIDADVLKPSIPKELGFSAKLGLIDYLNGNVDSVADIMYATNIEKLKIIPAGELHYLANELLASEKMSALCEELQQRYSDRLIIFDCPPILGINETSVLAQLMGQALIVVEENKSSITEIQKANEMLPDTLAKGLILNKAIHSQKELYGHYGYGYGYGKRTEP